MSIWDEWARRMATWARCTACSGAAGPRPDGGHIDQIAKSSQTLKTNPDSRRIIVSAWNVADLDKMALMPCHAFFQFYVAPPPSLAAKGRLSCQLYQRSADIFLGVPFNIASYALLTHMVAQQCDLDVGDFIWTGGDCHIYSNHHEQVELQLSRAPFAYPTLHIKRKPDSIFDYQFEDFESAGLPEPCRPSRRRWRCRRGTGHATAHHFAPRPATASSAGTTPCPGICPRTWRTSSAPPWAARSSWGARPGIRLPARFRPLPGRVPMWSSPARIGLEGWRNRRARQPSSSAGGGAIIL